MMIIMSSISLPALEEVRVAMNKQEPARLGLLRSAENLIGQMSGPNVAKVTEKAEEVKGKWEELNVAMETRNKGRSYSGILIEFTMC